MTAPVALFDFDGTVVRRDSTRTLVVELARLQPWRALRALPHAMSLKLARSAASVQSAKCALLGSLVRGSTPARIAMALDRAAEIVRADRRPEVVHAIRQWSTNGGRAIVVSASPSFFLRVALQDLPVEVVATEFKVEHGCFSGALAAPVCFGKEKVTALVSHLGPDPLIDEAWSDSLQDLPMMRLARRRLWLCPPADAREVRELDPSGEVVAPSVLSV